MNVLAISRTSNSVPIGAETPKRGPDHDLSFLLGDRRTYALNLIRDWRQQLEHINGLQKKSIKKTVDEAMRLIFARRTVFADIRQFFPNVVTEKVSTP